MTAATTRIPTLIAGGDGITVRVISYRHFIDALLGRALELHGRGDVMVVEYETDQLGRGKLRAAAKAAFPNGLRRIVRLTAQVNFDYAKKLANRTDGAEQPKGGPTWQKAVTVNGRYTPLTAHRDDYNGDW